MHDHVLLTETHHGLPREQLQIVNAVLFHTDLFTRIVLLTKSRPGSIRIGSRNRRLVGSDSDSDGCDVSSSGSTICAKDVSV